MTRINTLPPHLLTDQHLMAEYRELPMVNASLRRSLASKNGVTGIPNKYTLNQGHVKFFYDKGKFLHDRYLLLIVELKSRDYNIHPDDRSVDWNVFKDNDYYNNWHVDEDAVEVNKERILERVSQRDEWYKYFGRSIKFNAYKTVIDEWYHRIYAPTPLVIH